MTSVEDYTKKIIKLIHHLPTSEIRFLSFVEGRKKLVPKLNTSARIWIDTNVHPNPLYIIPGVKSDNFFYIHRESEIKYTVYLNELNKVVGFDPEESSHSEIKSSKGGNIRVNWGNHITIGVNELDDILMFCSHITEYRWNAKMSLDDRRQLTCNVPFMTDLNETMSCFTWGGPDGTTMEKYRNIGNDPDAFTIIRAVHAKLMDATIGGKTQKKRMKGGNDMYLTSGFTNGFINFISETKITPIYEKKPKLCEVILVDDQTSEYMMIRYNEDHGDGMDEWIIRSNVFVMDKQFVNDAFAIYQIPVEERTVEQTQLYQNFINTGLVPVGQLVAAY